MVAKAQPLIAISMGDPAGIGAEVILKSASRLASQRGAPALIVVGDLEVMTETARRLHSRYPAARLDSNRTCAGRLQYRRRHARTARRACPAPGKALARGR